MKSLKVASTSFRGFSQSIQKYTLLGGQHVVHSASNAAGSMKGSSTLEGQIDLQPFLLPQETGPPRYKTWSYLAQNEIALEVGRKMFYTDVHGKLPELAVVHHWMGTSLGLCRRSKRLMNQSIDHYRLDLEQLILPNHCQVQSDCSPIDTKISLLGGSCIWPGVEELGSMGSITEILCMRRIFACM